MATPISGAIAASDLNTLFGRSSSAAFSFNDATYKKLICASSCACICINKGHASAYINSTTTTVNIATGLFSTPSTVTTYRVMLDTSAIVGSSSTGSYALDTGQLPSGSSLVINNYGKIQGAGGASSGGTGGNALRSNYSNQTVTINNKSGAYIQAGGGGGGQGGTGGTGGKGGTGQYISGYTPTYGYVYNYGACYSFFTQCLPRYSRGSWSAYWQGPAGSGSTYPHKTTGFTWSYGGHCYRVGCLVSQSHGCGCCGPQNCYYYQIGQYQHTGCTPNYAYSCGGNGGGGGAGGAGGVGQGYGQAAGSGSTGSGGSSGSSGGTNAGSGGTGGTGGTGGAGGAFGVAGSSGSSGNTGATGNSGNYGSGSAGSGGSSGSSGGAAGNYLVKGSSTTTLNNSGTVSGNLA